MTREQFWKLVDQVKGNRSPEAAITKLLRKLTPLFRIKSTLIHWTEKHTDGIYGEPRISSDDGFIDFRYGLIARGKDVYESALRNLDSLADLKIQGEIPNELFGYVAEELYEELTAEDEMPRLPPPKKRPKPVGDEWDFDDANQNASRLPKLWAKYGAK